MSSSSDTFQAMITEYCQQKGYQHEIHSDPKDPNKIRIDVCNLSERTIINIYTTGKIVVQGKPNHLKKEFDDLKTQLEKGPISQIGSKKPDKKACNATYDIMISEIRELVKDSWSQISKHCETIISPSKYVSYVTKISNEASAITVTQFQNGKLLLQGKFDPFFELCCDHIEKLAKPSNKDVAARFVSTDQSAVDEFVAKYTPDMIGMAEREVKKCLVSSYGFLETHDQNWFIASKCLCLSGIMLPEYSAFVMPSSKAFEGFCKKILVAIGLFPQGHFDSKKANFANLSDKAHPLRVTVCSKDKYVETHLEKLRVSLDQYRNFMMHSDNSFVTKVETQERATNLVNEIMNAEEELFRYFGTVFEL